MPVRKAQKTKAILKNLVVLGIFWFFFFYIKWFPTAEIYSQCFEPSTLAPEEIYAPVDKKSKTLGYSGFRLANDVFQETLYDQGYKVVVSTYGKKRTAKPEKISLDGTVVVRINSTTGSMLNPSVRVFVSTIINNEKYIIHDFNLSDEVFDTLQQSHCYAEIVSSH